MSPNPHPDPLQVILQKTPGTFQYLRLKYFYLRIYPFYYDFSIRAISEASGLRFGRFWIRCDRGEESYHPMASL